MAQRLSDVMAKPVDETIKPKARRLGDIMAMSPIQYSDEEEKDLFSSGVIAVPSVDERKELKNKGHIGAFEAFARNAKPETFIPVAGTVSEGVKTVSILSATSRLQANDYKDNAVLRNRDAQLLASEIRSRVEEQERGYSWGGKIVNVVKEMPAVMAEFLATGGLATSGRMAARKGAEAVLKKATDKAVTRIVTKKIAGTLGSIASRTAALGAYKVPVGMAKKELDERISLSDKGVSIYESGKTRPFTSLIKSVGDVAFEVASEQAGGTIRKVASAAISPVAKYAAPAVSRLSENRMVKAISMLTNKLKVGGLAKELSDKVKFDGILEEYGEERWGNFLRAVANVEDFGAGDSSTIMDRVVASIPSMEESLAELAAFSIPAVGFAGASFFDRVNSDNAKGVDEELISKVADEILVDQGIKEPPISVNVTPEMEGAVDSGLPVTEVGPSIDTLSPLNFATAEEYAASKGKPLFHATSKKFSAFDVSKSNDGMVWFGKSKDSVEVFRRGFEKASGSAYVIEAYVDLKNPLTIDSEKLFSVVNGKEARPDIIAQAKKDGHDGLYVKGKDGSISSVASFYNDSIKTKSQLTAEWEAANKQQKSVTTVPKMVEKEFIEEYEEAPESIDKEYERTNKERMATGESMVGSSAVAGKFRKGRGMKLSATLRQYRGTPTATEVKDEIKKLNTISVGKTVETSDGQGIVKKNPAYGKVQVEVNGKSKAYIMEDISPINITKEQAISSLKAKAEKTMAKYLKDIGREYKPESIKRTRVVKRMVPAEQAEKKPADTGSDLPPVSDNKTDDQIRARELASYLANTENNSGLIFSDDIGESGPSRVVGAIGTERPKWWSGLDISMKRTTEVLNKFANGEKLTEAQQRDFNAIMDAGGRSYSMEITSDNEIQFLRSKEKAIQAGATEDEATEIAQVDAEQVLMDEAGIVDDDVWISGVTEEAPVVLETPKEDNKVSKVASDIVNTLVEKGFNDLSELEQSMYSPNQKKTKLEALSKMMENYERAKRIAFGEEEVDPVDAHIIFNAVETRATAEGDMDTLVKMVASPVGSALSKSAQIMRAAGYNKASKEQSPVAAMQDIESIRSKEVNKKSDVGKETDVQVKNIKEMTKQEMKKLDWDSFVKSLEC